MKIFWISSPFLFLVTATMLVGGRDCRTQFWKGITHGPFHQSLVSSGQVVSEENIVSDCIRRTTHAKWWQRLTWPFGSGELKKKGGAYYFLSVVKSKKNHGFNNNFFNM
jgi:hypothetical protein